MSQAPVPQAPPPRAKDTYTITLTHDEVSHLLHGVDLAATEIQERSAIDPEPSALGPLLLEVTAALRARLVALLAPSQGD